MASVTKRDELNLLEKEKFNVKKYFEEMDLSKSEIRFRIRLEGLIEEALLSWLYFFETYTSSGGDMIDNIYLRENLNRRLRDAVTDEIPIDKEIEDHLKRLSKDILDGLLKREKEIRDGDADASAAQENAANSSSEEDDEERRKTREKALHEAYIAATKIDEAVEEYREKARKIAADQSNALANKEQYEEAKLSGLEFKTWVTEKDELVRSTHRKVDEKTIPIDDFFIVGGYKMRFPLDVFYGAPDREIINCRCVCKYQ